MLFFEGMSKKNADNPEVIEFTEKIGRLKIDDLPVFFEEFNKIYTELIERKQLLEVRFDWVNINIRGCDFRKSSYLKKKRFRY